MKLKKNKQLIFLDTLLTQTEQAIMTEVHTKTTSSGDCINYNSICSERYKTGVISGLLHRAYKISSNWQLFHQEVLRIKQLLTNNNFPQALIDKTINSFINNKTIQANNEDNSSTVKLFYQSQMCSNHKVEENQLHNILNKNLQPLPNNVIKLFIYYRNKKLKNLVMRNKYHKSDEQSSVVYQYKCQRDECNSSYIGYTQATLTERMRNHGQHGSIIKHLQDNHNIIKEKTKKLMESVQVIGKADTKNELLIMEAILIKEKRPQLNEQEEGRDRVLHIF